MQYTKLIPKRFKTKCGKIKTQKFKYIHVSLQNQGKKIFLKQDTIKAQIRGVAQVVASLPSKCEALRSNPSTPKEKNKKAQTTEKNVDVDSINISNFPSKMS
jgi:hypothetical protein